MFRLGTLRAAVNGVSRIGAGGSLGNAPHTLSAALCGGFMLGGITYRGEPLAAAVGRVVGSAGRRGDVL